MEFGNLDPQNFGQAYCAPSVNVQDGVEPNPRMVEEELGHANFSVLKNIMLCAMKNENGL